MAALATIAPSRGAMAAEDAAARNVLAKMEAAWNKTDSYTCRMHVWSKRGKAEKVQDFDFMFKKPRMVRLKVRGTPHKGAAVVYRDGKVKAAERVLGIRFKKGLGLKDPMLSNLRGVPFWEADMGGQVALIRSLLPIAQASVARDPETVTLTLKWRGEDPKLKAGVHDYVAIWRLDADNWFPRQRTTTEDGVRVEEVRASDLNANAGLTDKLFRL